MNREELKQKIIELLEVEKNLTVSKVIALLKLKDTRDIRDKIRSLFNELNNEYENIKLIKKQNTYILKLLYRKNLKIEDLTIDNVEDFKNIAKHIIGVITIFDELIEYYIHKKHILEYVYKCLYDDDMQIAGFKLVEVNIYEIIDPEEAKKMIIESIENKTNYYIKRIRKELIKKIKAEAKNKKIEEIIKELEE